MAIKAIIFDCFGVLVLSGQASLLQDYPDLSDELSDLILQSDYGYISRDEFNQAACRLTGLSLTDFKSRYWSANIRNESAFKWVRTLKAAGNYKVGLLSNIGQGWLSDFVPEADDEQLFDAVVLSGDVGMTKPAAEIFQLTAKRLGVTPAECVMIDDLLTNVDGARRAGMEAILFGTTSQSQADLGRLLEPALA
jgi:HAD superfamily hydrolase (TIGR01509 family)